MIGVIHIKINLIIFSLKLGKVLIIEIMSEWNNNQSSLFASQNSTLVD